MLMTTKKSEKWFFLMPIDGEEFLCAVAAIQGLLEETKKREIEPTIVMYCPGTENQMFVPALGPVLCINDYELELMNSRQFDLVFEFRTQDARAIAVDTSRHLSQAYSILLGGAPKILPDLSAIPLSATVGRCDIYLLPWYGAETLSNMLSLNCQGLVVAHDLIEKDLTLAETWLCVLNSRVVVGPRSVATMLAASIGRSVVEIYPPSGGHREWLSKWGAKDYSMIYMEEADVKPAMVFKAMESVCKRLLQARVVSTPTAQST